MGEPGVGGVFFYCTGSGCGRRVRYPGPGEVVTCECGERVEGAKAGTAPAGDGPMTPEQFRCLRQMAVRGGSNISVARAAAREIDRLREALAAERERTEGAGAVPAPAGDGPTTAEGRAWDLRHVYGDHATERDDACVRLVAEAIRAAERAAAAAERERVAALLDAEAAEREAWVAAAMYDDYRECREWDLRAATCREMARKVRGGLRTRPRAGPGRDAT